MKTRWFYSLTARIAAVTLLALPLTATFADAQPRPAEEQNAQETRDRLHNLLDQYPPALAQVLRLDPSLLARPDYLAPYPALAAYLSQHPEIARTPSFFLGEIRLRDPETAKISSIRLLGDVLAGLAFLTGFTILLLSLGWLIRAALTDRRWQRLMKIQTEAHTKLLDRLTSHEDLLAYIQSPAGRRFLEAAPVALDNGARRPVNAPVGRMLWSVQAGIVLVAVGIGLFFAERNMWPEIAEPIYVIGIVVVALGLGFVVSALVAYVLSRQLGLLDAPQPHDA